VAVRFGAWAILTFEELSWDLRGYEKSATPFGVALNSLNLRGTAQSGQLAQLSEPQRKENVPGARF